MDTVRSIREIVGFQPVYCKVGVVVNVEDTTCDVELVESRDVKYEKVRLKAHLDGDKSIVIKPKQDSYVLIALLSPTDAFIAMYDEVDSISVKLSEHEIMLDENGLAMNMSSGKYELKNNQDSLKTLINDLITEITKITVTTGTGPSGTPINLPAFQAIAQRLPNFFM